MRRLSRKGSTMKSQRTILLSLLLLALVVAIRPAGAASRGPTTAGPNKTSEALLVDCAGRFVRISTRAPRILAQGSLWDHPSMAAFRLPAGPFDGCLVADVQLDPRRSLLFAAVAKEKREDADERRSFRIVVLRLPDLRRVQSREIERSTEEGLRLLLTPESHELLASYDRYEERGGEEGWLNVTERFSVPDLAPAGVREDFRKAAGEDALPPSVALSKLATWTAGGRLLDRNWLLDENGRVLQRLDPYALLPAAAQSDLKSLERRGATGQPYLAIAFADSAGQRALFAIGHDGAQAETPRGAALWVYDVGSGASLRPVATPERVAAYDPTQRETPTVHLSPDGNFVLLERFEWRQAAGDEPGSVARFKTGPVDLYDLATGALVRTFTLAPAPGLSSRLLGISPDGSVALFGNAERLYLVPLDGSRAPSVLTTGSGFDPFWSVGVVFR